MGLSATGVMGWLPGLVLGVAGWLSGLVVAGCRSESCFYRLLDPCIFILSGLSGTLHS